MILPGISGLVAMAKVTVDIAVGDLGSTVVHRDHLSQVHHVTLLPATLALSLNHTTPQLYHISMIFQYQTRSIVTAGDVASSGDVVATYLDLSHGRECPKCPAMSQATSAGNVLNYLTRSIQRTQSPPRL